MQQTMTRTVLAVAAVVAWGSLGGAPAAHHSHAMFDGSVETEIAGTLRAVRFANPHVYLQIEATHRDGAPLEPSQVWAIEMSTTGNMAARGVTPDLLPRGVSISVKVNPLFSGGPSGNYTNIVMIDGVRNASTGQDWQPAQP
jgi:hypothetical protein